MVNKKGFYIEELFLGAVILLMLAIAFANVLCRYFLKVSIAFSEELVVYLFLYATMLGAPAAYSRGANMGFTLLTDKVPAAKQKYVVLITTIASIVFFGILFYYGCERCYTQYDYGVLTPIMKIPEWLFSLSIPLGSLLYIWRTIQYTAAVFKGRVEFGQTAEGQP